MLASRKLRHCFYDHTVTVPLAFPLGTVLQNWENTRWAAQWNIKLGEFDVRFEPRTTIKSQPLADFVVEWVDPGKEPDNRDLLLTTLAFDGSLMINGVGGGIMLTVPTSNRLQYAIQLQFPATNNVAKCEGLLAGLCLAMALGVWHL